jgi:hypothetical protein
MKYLSFKIIACCIILPPVCYILTLQILENRLHDRYARQVQAVLLGDAGALLSGKERLKVVVPRNVNRFLDNDALIRMGLRVGVDVHTRRGTLLYPQPFENSAGLGAAVPLAHDIAEENYRLLNEGLEVIVDVVVDHNTPLSNLILGFYVGCGLLALFFYYRRGTRKDLRDRAEKAGEILQLSEMSRLHQENLENLKAERGRLADELVRLRAELHQQAARAIENEDQMIEEVVALEEKIQRNLDRQNAQEEEVEALREKIAAYEKDKDPAGRSRRKQLEAPQKRFNTLYKNLSLHDRALKGFGELSEDMKLKCEEVIHQINDNPQQVPVKRKVFGKKGIETILEVAFSYNGRLYYRSGKEQKTEVLAIGTKNSQEKDLGFLNRFNAA